MNCNQCGKEVDIFQWKHCPSCGSGLRDEKFTNSITFFFKSKRNISIVLFILIVSAIIISWSFYRSNREIERKQNELDAFINQQSVVGLEWSPVNKMMPLIADDKNILGTLKVSSQQNTQLRIELEAEGITDKKIETVSIQPETKQLDLGASFSNSGYGKLSQAAQSTKLKIVVFQVNPAGEKVLLSNESDIFFNSIHEIIWKKNGKNNTQNVLKLVDKDDPSVIELVHAAAKYVAEFGGPKDAMLGYMADDEKGAKAQIEAIFKTMSVDYQIRYIASPFSYNGLEMQKLRDPAQVISTKSGICIDLSLLMTAALENLGFDPVLVFTDNHVWPGIELGYNSDKFIFIESTALSGSPAKAIEIATKNWKLIQDKKTPVAYNLVRVTGARSEGVLPIINKK